MPETTTFALQESRRWQVISNVKLLVEGVRERLLPIFADADKAVQRFEERLYEHLWDANESQPSEQQLAAARPDFDEYLSDEDGRPYYELRYIGNHLLLMSLVALYHQWERTLKAVLADEFNRNGFAEEWRIRTFRADFALLRKWIDALGFPSAQGQVLGDLNSLLLIVNVAKHGDGDSCQKLAKKHPELFWQMPDKLEDQPTAERLSISPALFDRFSTAIVTFWEIFPGSSHVGVKTLREPELAQR